MSLLHDYLKVASNLAAGVSLEELEKICDQIQSEEEPRFKNIELMPSGENVFLSLERETDEDIDTVEYITLEKDDRGFFAGYWLRKGQGNLIRTRVWPISEQDAHHTVLGFIKIYRYLTEYVEK